MNYNNIIFAIIGGIIGFWIATVVPFSGSDLTEDKLDELFRNHTVSGKHVVAIKRYSPQLGTNSYLGTIHGYPNNLSVCEELIAPYNKDSSLSVIPGGKYYCEVLNLR